MEALILILINALAPLLTALLGGFGALIGSAFFAVFSLLLELTGLLLRRCFDARANNRTTTKPATAPATLASAPTTANSANEPAPIVQRAPSTPARQRRWIRWLLYGTSGLTAAVLLTLVVINQWFIDDLARWLLNNQRERSGITIAAENIDGNLFTGRFRATGITVRRLNHPAGLIYLTVQRIETQIDVWDVLGNPLVVESLTVDGVRGRFERGVPGQEPVAKSSSEIGFSFSYGNKKSDVIIELNPEASKTKRPFIISALTVSDLEVAYADHTRKRPLVLPVTIATLTAAPLRSRFAVFDVLFRSNATGSIAGSPLRITTSGDDLGRDTQWHVQGLPVAVLSDQIGGPFTLLSGGTADVHVVDHWRMSADDRVIVMDWSMILHQVKAEVPDDLSPVMALLAKPAVAFINAKADRMPLSFRVEIDEDRFNGAASAEAADLWEVVSDSAAATLAKALGIETDSVKNASDLLLDKAKDALDKWRKKKQ